MQKPCFGLQALDIIIKLEYQGVSFDRSPIIPFPLNQSIHTLPFTAAVVTCSSNMGHAGFNIIVTSGLSL